MSEETETKQSNKSRTESQTQIKVSVIMPVYNAETYLEKALRGVMGQTLKEIEIICVNDGSTDRSLRILEDLAAEDGRLKVITQENSTAGAARNRGMKAARGEYLSFLDADDLFEPQMLERAYLAAKEKDTEIVVYRSDRYNEATGTFEEANWTIREELLPEKEVFSHKDMKDFFYCFAAGWAWDKLFDTDFIRKLGVCFQEQRWINDRFFVECALAAADRIYVLQELLVHKRINHAGALTSIYGQENGWKNIYSCLASIRGWLLEKMLYEELQADYLNFALFHVLWNVDRFIDSPQFETMYEDTRKEQLRLTGLANATEELFYRKDEFAWLQKLLYNDAKTYQWERRLSRRDGSYLFPFELIPRGAKIVLYGAGKVGQAFYRQVKFSGWCEIVAWVDRDNEKFDSVVLRPDYLKDITCEFVVIAVRDKGLAIKMKKNLILNLQIQPEKIIWKEPEIILSDYDLN